MDTAADIVDSIILAINNLRVVEIDKCLANKIVAKIVVLLITFLRRRALSCLHQAFLHRCTPRQGT